MTQPTANSTKSQRRWMSWGAAVVPSWVVIFLSIWGGPDYSVFAMSAFSLITIVVTAYVSTRTWQNIEDKKTDNSK